MTEQVAVGGTGLDLRNVEVEVFTDFCCPFCLIGGRHLDDAIASLAGEILVRTIYRPFELDPAADQGGIDVRRKLYEKHGIRAEQVWPGIEATARASGIPLELARQPLAYPTLAAHTLVRHAEGQEGALSRAISEAYFHDAAPIADHETLARIAEPHGLSRVEVLAILASEGERARTRAEAQESVQRGIRSVPTIIIAGQTAMSSTQSVKDLAEALAGHAA